MGKGIFVTFEGLDGSGKSTQISLLCEWLFERKIEFVRTREPGGTELGKSIRELLLNPPEPISTMAETFLFAADRAQHFSHIVVPKIKSGTLVISDRCLDSSIVYQGFIRGVGASFVKHVSRSCMRLTDPNLTILLDMPAELVAQRKQKVDASRFDTMPLDTHQRIRAAYLARAKSETRRIKIIDATKPIDEVHTMVLSLVKPLLKGEKSGKHL